MKRYIRPSDDSNKKEIKSSIEEDKEYWKGVYEEMDNPDPYEQQWMFLSDIAYQTKEFDFDDYVDLELNDEISNRIDRFAYRYFAAEEEDDLKRIQQIGKDVAAYLKTLK